MSPPLPVHRPFTRQVRPLSALLVGSLLCFASNGPARAQGTRPPTKSDVALNGRELASSTRDKARSATDCLAQCRATKGCTGFTFQSGACSLLQGSLTETAARGAVSCRMPCEAIDSARLPTRPSAPPPTEVPGVKVALPIPESTFHASNPNASVLLTSFNMMVLNGVRTNPGITSFVGVDVRNDAAFPGGMMKVVVKGWAADAMGNRTLVLAKGSFTSTCQLPVQTAWRCELTMPVGTLGQSQTVNMTADTRTVISEISIESTTSPDPKLTLAIPESRFVAPGVDAGLLLAGSVMVLNGVRTNPNSPLFVTASARNPALFPANTMKFVVKGSMAEPIYTRTMTLTSGSTTTSCQLPLAPASWRCEMTIPITAFGQGQSVKITADTRALISELSIE